jgi:cytochrome c553
LIEPGVARNDAAVPFAAHCACPKSLSRKAITPMKPAPLRLFLASIALAGAVAAEPADTPPPWAFVVNPPGLVPAPDEGSRHRVPGSERAFTLTQIRDLFAAPDWHPGDHPPMPDIVAHGRKPAVLACGYCHLPNGLGRPENSSLAGLPAEYIVQQVRDFASGARRSSEARSLPVNFMISTANAVSDAELRIAAEYFSALPPKPWIRVIESPTAPRTQVIGWMLAPADGGGHEPIGRRIIEMPEDLERTELRDARSGFVAWVPPGSLARGRALAEGGSVTRCAACHGADLKGMGPVPALAGRSPSYLYRQLYDFKNGMRNGAWGALMKPVVEALGHDDMVALAAYCASLAP